MSVTTPSGPAGVDTAETGHSPAPQGPHGRRRWWLVMGLAVVLAVIAALVAVVAWPDDDDGTTTSGSGTTTSTTEEQATTSSTTEPTTAPSTTAPPTTASPTTAVPPAADTTTAVFPSGSGPRYYDPVALTRVFAVDFVGFTDPLVGAYQAGDARSGEVEVRANARGPVTTVMVRKLSSDGAWWVVGAATPNISLTTPAAGDTIHSPVTLQGSALAWEGNVRVEVRQDGTSAPIGTGVVMGGGDVMRPFTGTVEFSSPGASHGALVLLSHSAEDGSVWQASVLRVAF